MIRILLITSRPSFQPHIHIPARGLVEQWRAIVRPVNFEKSAFFQTSKHVFEIQFCAAAGVSAGAVRHAVATIRSSCSVGNTSRTYTKLEQPLIHIVLRLQ